MAVIESEPIRRRKLSHEVVDRLLARITHGIERVVREMVRPDWPTAAAKPQR